MIEVRTRYKTFQEIEEIGAWLLNNVGQGNQRFRKDTWMGTNDWFFYHDYPEENEDGDTADHEDDPDTIFVFRREEDAAMFSLKWL